MQAQNETLSFCVPGASDLQREYLKVHGFLALMICVLGSIANCINIAVLSRREMASSTNSILTGLAVADLLVMLEYIPFALHMYIQIGTQINLNTYGWAVFVYFHSIFSQTFHTISIWLTVMLAVWRYIAIAFPQRNRSWCDANRTRLAIISSYLICPFICLPIYFAMNIVKLKITAENNTEFAEAMSLPENRTIYVLQMNEDRAFVTAIFWMYSVILKLIPCLALSVLSLCLISKLAATEKRRQLLMKSNSSSTQNEAERKCLNAAAAASARRSARTDRTTRMLLAVLGLFLLTEFPQGLFGLISALAPHFFETCYAAFGEVMDMLALISSSVNFVLYCSMSRQFRTTFARLAGAVCVPSPDSRKKVMRGMELATQTTGQM